jgi:hypothetical protein
MTSCWLHAEIAIMTTAVIRASVLRAETASDIADNQQALMDTVSNWLAEQKL